MGSFLILLVFLGIAIAFALWAVGIYNGLVTARNAFKNAFAQIDVQLQRRFDLIPNLVETVKGYMSHERETLEAVTQARTMAQAGLSAAKADLKASQNMMQLTEELTSTENRVAFARQAYNDSVMAYNNRREVFPSSVVAGMFNFKEAALLDIPADRAEVREAPKVTF